MAENEETPQAEEAPKAAPAATSSNSDDLLRAPLRGEVTRRGLFSTLGMGWALFAGAGALGLGAITRFLFPNVLYEPPQQFKIGFPDEFAIGDVDLRFKATYGVWVVREPEGFYALSTVCTHLGCTPNWLSSEGKFKCPCHGSGFVITGINVEGPAPRPLERYKIGLSPDGQIEIDKNTKYQEEKGQWTMEGAYLNYIA
ncbi:MAG: ubiquinol-cytochrome c reductase iron-sulfur subunit [Planctomycetes bacterium]|nr:ubiquinol-cytochrome c reductase iron-sulfur subunit [Planctomycetota bacterium]